MSDRDERAVRAEQLEAWLAKKAADFREGLLCVLTLGSLLGTVVIVTCLELFGGSLNSGTKVLLQQVSTLALMSCFASCIMFCFIAQSELDNKREATDERP